MEHVDFPSDFYSYANPLSRLAEQQLKRRGVHIPDTKEKPFFVFIVMQIRFSSQPELGEPHNLRM